jgi:hypothetical protein
MSSIIKSKRTIFKLEELTATLSIPNFQTIAARSLKEIRNLTFTKV